MYSADIVVTSVRMACRPWASGGAGGHAFRVTKPDPLDPFSAAWLAADIGNEPGRRSAASALSRPPATGVLPPVLETSPRRNRVAPGKLGDCEDSI